jgi:hypothetical protein
MIYFANYFVLIPSAAKLAGGRTNRAGLFRDLGIVHLYYFITEDFEKERRQAESTVGCWYLQIKVESEYALQVRTLGLGTTPTHIHSLPRITASREFQPS